VNEATLTTSENQEAVVEAADGLYEGARRGCGLQEVLDVDRRLHGVVLVFFQVLSQRCPSGYIFIIVSGSTLQELIS
jgi:hypothetical protein